MSAARVLVVDDDENMGRACSRLFQRMGHLCEQATSVADALERLSEDDYDLVLSDLVMPGEDGLSLLKKVRERYPALPVILMTGYGTIESAVSAMKEGATNYITKPFDRDELEAAVHGVLEHRRLAAQVQTLERRLADDDPAPELLGTSPAMLAVKDLVRAAARMPSTVLVIGASGTGKELVARAIHQASPRSRRPFIPVNCGALPDGLAESELFGNVKGAYTGAGVARDGLFRAADGGTIFLDEIGEMPPDLQVKLLRVLQENAVRPVGGTREAPVDVRVVAATNQSPQEAIAAGRLREDLYYRLAVLTVEVPPLAARADDVPYLAERFLERFRERYGGGPVTFDERAAAALRQHSWPGNVRELENAIDRAFAVAGDTEIIELKHLPEAVRDACEGGGASSIGSAGGPTTFKEGEAVLIRKALRDAEGNKTRAAKSLGISRPLLYKRMKEYGIDPDSL